MQAISIGWSSSAEQHHQLQVLTRTWEVICCGRSLRLTAIIISSLCMLTVWMGIDKLLCAVAKQVYL